jgi:hypothetical protein
MSELSRRSLVATAAVLPALAAPAAAANLIDGNSFDAELLRLGAEFEKIEQEWLVWRAVERKRRAAHTAACERAGLPRRDFADFSSYDEWRAYNEKRWAVPYEGKDQEEAETDEHGVDVVMGDLCARKNKLIDAIMSHEPTTVAGLTVMARAVMMHSVEWWDDGADGEEHACHFFEAFCSVVGTKSAVLINAARA